MKEYFFNLFFNTIFIDLSLPFYILWINKIQEIFLWTSYPFLALSFQSTFANFLRFEKLRTHLSLFLFQGTKVMKSNPLEKEFFWNNFNTDISLSILLAKASFGFLLISMLFYWFQTTFKYDTQRFPLPKALFASHGKGSGRVFLGKLPLLTMWSANLTLISLLSIRWIESGHFPLSNLYESLLFLSWSLTTIHLFLENTLNKREKARISPLVSMQSNASLPLLFVGAQRQRVDSSITLGAITSPLALFTNAFATFSLPQDMQKATVLVPALQSNWLIMHVSVMILSYAALLSGSLLAVAFLIIKFVDDNKGSVNIPFFSNSILGIRKSQSPPPSCSDVSLFPPYPRRCSASFGRLAVQKALLKKNDVPSFGLTSKICFAPEARKGKEALDAPWHNGLTPLEVCVMRRLNKSLFNGYSSSSAKGTEATYNFINPFVLEKQKFTNIEDLLLVRSKSSISTKQVKTLSKVEEISQAPNSYASLWKVQVASSSYLLTSLIHSSRTPTLYYPKQVSPKTYTTEKADEISFLRPLPIRGLRSWQSKNGLASRRVLDSPMPFGVRRFAGFPPTEDAKQIEDLAAYIKDVNAPKEENQSPIQNLLQILDNLSYRSIGLGFAFLTIGILSGAVWANEAWGSYWNWDPKETWAFITWLIFALYLHTRLSKGWVGKESAFVATFGFVIIWFCYLGVNLFGKGLHSYGWFHTIQ